MNNKRIQYFVEGQCEKQLVDSLKKEPSLILPGKSKVFNTITGKMTPYDFIAIQPKSILVFIFDTDVEKTDILEHNLKMVKKYAKGTIVILVPQVKNIEDELTRSCNIHSPLELTGSKSLSNFKTDFCSLKDCRKVLEWHGFKMRNLWIKEPGDEFSKYKQESEKIKKYPNGH